MSEYIIHRDDELYHFGVKGQKWGVRRYQNEDGSYKSGAEGRYDPDGQTGVNKKSSGKTLKNYAKSKLGIYKDGDGNPYVSPERRAKRKAEEEEAQEWLDDMKRRYETSKREEAEKKALKEKQKAERKAENEKRKAEKRAAQEKRLAEYKAAKNASKESEEKEKAAKKEEKMSKNSYKKIAGKYLLKNIGLTAAGNILGNAVANKTGSTALGLYTNAAVQGTGKTINMIKSGKEAYELHQYRKKKSAQHSAFDEYDELYHGELGGFYGIKRV